MSNNPKNNITPSEFDKMNSEEKIIKMVDGMVPPSGKPEEEVLDSLLDKIERSSPAKSFHLRPFIRVAAAVAILLLLIYPFNKFLLKSHESTHLAEQKEITLPDGTEVILNADTKIEWNNRKFTSKRRLELNGEAWFDVKKGEDFIINTNNGKVEILGTKLNVYSRGEKFSVSCMSGKVSISSNNQKQIINPGETVKLNGSTLIKSKTEAVKEEALWISGIIHFEEETLSVIFAELERQFDVSVKFKGDKNRKATIDFSNENLIEALEVVCIPMELNYEIRNRKKIIISEKE